MRDHRSLLVWRRAHDLAIEARRTAGSFPKQGYTALVVADRPCGRVHFDIVEAGGSASEGSRPGTARPMNAFGS